MNSEPALPVAAQEEACCPLEAVRALQDATEAMLASVTAIDAAAASGGQRPGTPVSSDALLPLFIASLIQVQHASIQRTSSRLGARAETQVTPTLSPSFLTWYSCLGMPALVMATVQRAL